MALSSPLSSLPLSFRLHNSFDPGVPFPEDPARDGESERSVVSKVSDADNNVDINSTLSADLALLDGEDDGSMGGADGGGVGGKKVIDGAIGDDSGGGEVAGKLQAVQTCSRSLRHG